MGARGHCTAGACDVAADPELDARAAHPLWLNEDEGLLHVRALRAHHATASAAGVARFDLWRIPGCKRLFGINDAILTVSIGTHHVRILLDAALTDGAPFTCTVPLTSHLRGQLAAFQSIAGLLEGAPLPTTLTRPVTRAGLLHLRALQALDAMQARASHRDLAIALFGLESVRADWHADGVLRAQVRHLVARAEGFMRQGYLHLAGLRHAPPSAPGDEALR